MSATPEILVAVNKASERWKNGFNSGDATACAAQYEPNAVMKAEPFGTYEGTDKICEFWQQLINDGFTDVEYVEPQIEIVDERNAVLTSGWKMNKAHGVIHRELWVLQEDGTAKLREDHFEAQG